MRTAPPLAGVVVLDLSRILAGPFCSQMLSDLGATVWKIEALHGDDTRHWGPPFQDGEGAYFLSTNRGKHSVAVNLKEPRGQELVRRLAAQADVLLENFKTGDLARYGLDYPSLKQLNPRLIYTSITGFGHTGPRACQPGYDAAIQGISGAMSITGEPDGPPTKTGVAWIDIMTGVNAAAGVLAALYEREQSGLGQHLDLALLDVALASLVNQVQSCLMTGVAPVRRGNAHPQIVPYQPFEAQDGWFMLAIGNDGQFERCCLELGAPELLDERFRTNEGRVEHRHELAERLQAVFSSRSRAEWLERLGRASVPVAPINDIAEALADDQVAARGVRQTLEHPVLGSFEVIGSPLKHFSRTPLDPQKPPPTIGEHTYQVLQEALDMSEEEIESLSRDNVVGCG